MTRRDVRDRLQARLEHAGVEVSAAILESLETYYWLLARWNPKVNLTALPLDPPRDETFDRLFVEPVVAAGLIQPVPSAPSAVPVWFDLGSGGGSPAIPLKLMRPYWALTMVESKERKAAFLREATRALRLRDVEVANARFEELEGSAARADLITVRAVKLDQSLAIMLKRLVNSTGIVAAFGAGALLLPGLLARQTSVLIPQSSATLTVFDVPRGT